MLTNEGIKAARFERDAMLVTLGYKPDYLKSLGKHEIREVRINPKSGKTSCKIINQEVWTDLEDNFYAIKADNHGIKQLMKIETA